LRARAAFRRAGHERCYWRIEQIQLPANLKPEIPKTMPSAESSRWNSGFNFAFEQETYGAKSSAYTISQGIGYTLIDQVLNVGAEMEWEIDTEKGARSNAEQSFLIGPSVQVRPTKNTHLDLVALIGTNHNAPNLEGYIVFGIDFGKITGGENRYTPASISR
jgi:hypothetical protein